MSLLSIVELTAVFKSQILSTIRNGANIITLIIFTIIAFEDAFSPKASPAPTAWATSCKVAPIYIPILESLKFKIPSLNKNGYKNIAIVPNTTTVETAIALLYAGLFKTLSVANTAAAPQIALPALVKMVISLSSFKTFVPKRYPIIKVLETIKKAVNTPEKPTSSKF